MRAALVAAGFAGNVPLQRADVRDTELSGFAPAEKQLAVGLRRTSAGEPVDTLTRLFLMGLRVPVAAVAAALPDTGLGPWVDCGLIVREGEQVRALFQLAPVRGLYLAADPVWEGTPGPLHVMSYSGSSHSLALLSIRRKCVRALDLGCGSGIQALLAASHAGEVVASDANPRAVELTRFNAALNGMPHVTAREGDLFGPVAGERFDLIVSNPPFVISPDRTFLYRDGGRAGNDLIRELLAAAPEHLAPGGYFQMLCEWAHGGDEHWQTGPTRWLAGTGCDAWVIRVKTSAPAEHAESWVTCHEGDSPIEMADQMNRWINWYAAQGFEQFTYGSITLRKQSAGRPWMRFDAPPLLRERAGEAIEQGFARQDFLVAHPGDKLLSARLLLPPEVKWEQQLSPITQGWQVTDAQLRTTGGLGYIGTPNEFVMGLLDRCRGRLTLGEAITDLEAAIGEELDRDGVAAVVRQMVEQGFLVPTGVPG